MGARRSGQGSRGCRVANELNREGVPAEIGEKERKGEWRRNLQKVRIVVVANGDEEFSSGENDVNSDNG